MIRAICFAIVGFFYGGLLDLLGLMAAGGGHGSYVILGLAASPFSLLGNIVIALLGVPLLWAGAGLLLGYVGNRRVMLGFLVFMLVHYSSLAFILRPGGAFGDWSYAEKERGFILFCISFYASGQIALWAAFVLSLRRTPQRKIIAGHSRGVSGPMRGISCIVG